MHRIKTENKKNSPFSLYLFFRSRNVFSEKKKKNINFWRAGIQNNKKNILLEINIAIYFHLVHYSEYTTILVTFHSIINYLLNFS